MAFRAGREVPGASKMDEGLRKPIFRLAELFRAQSTRRRRR